jgi:hypothetical protein
MRLSKNDKAFIEFVKAECKMHGIKCDLRPTTYIRQGKIRCSGWFDADNAELVVAKKRSDFLEILAHEYCHLTQWREDIPEWEVGIEGISNVDDWLHGRDVDDIEKYIAAIRDLELDNEKRTVRIIKEWGLSIDPVAYTKRANAYIHFYNWMHYTRKWSKPENAPYKNTHVLGAMSERFNMQYKRLSPRVYAAFEAGGI